MAKETRATIQKHLANRLLQKNMKLGIREIRYESPIKVFSRLVDDYEYVYLLESVEGPKKLAEFSFIGFNLSKIIRVKDGKAEVLGEDKVVMKTSDSLEITREEVYTKRFFHKAFRFIGGAVGYVSYDAVRYWENLPSTTIDDLGFPDLEMGIYGDGIVFEHAKRTA